MLLQLLSDTRAAQVQQLAGVGLLVHLDAAGM